MNRQVALVAKATSWMGRETQVLRRSRSVSAWWLLLIVIAISGASPCDAQIAEEPFIVTEGPRDVWPWQKDMTAEQWQARERMSSAEREAFDKPRRDAHYKRVWENLPPESRHSLLESRLQSQLDNIEYNRSRGRTSGPDMERHQHEVQQTKDEIIRTQREARDARAGSSDKRPTARVQIDPSANNARGSDPRLTTTPNNPENAPGPSDTQAIPREGPAAETPTGRITGRGIVEAVGEAGKKLGPAGAGFMALDIVGRGMEDGSKGELKGPAEFYAELGEEVAFGTAGAAVAMGLGAAVGGLVGGPPGAALGAELVGGAMLIAGGHSAGERVGGAIVDRQRVDGPASLGAGSDFGQTNIQGTAPFGFAPQQMDPRARLRDELLQHPEFAGKTPEEQNQILDIVLRANDDELNPFEFALDAVPELPKPPVEEVGPAEGKDEETVIQPVEVPQQPLMTPEELARMETLQPREGFEEGSLADFMDQLNKPSSGENASGEARPPAGRDIGDFADQTIGSDLTAGPPPGTSPVYIRPNLTTTVNEDAINSGVGEIEQAMNARYSADYPQAARLKRALDDYKRARAEYRRMQAEHRRAQEITEYQRQLKEYYRQVAWQEQQYNNWLKQQHAAQQQQQYHPVGGHSGGH